MRYSALILICSFGLNYLLSGQLVYPETYWIYFTDKNNNGYDVGSPEEFLSSRSIDRRGWQGLPVDVSDLPVTAGYVENLKNMEVEVVHISKWLNGAAVRSSDPEILQKLYEEGYIDSVMWRPDDQTLFYPPKPSGNRFDEPLAEPPQFNYGYSSGQITMVNIDVLHQKGFTGGGVNIAVLDAGFKNVDSVPSFINMIAEGRLMDTINFVDNRDIFRTYSSHGMNVLSIMGAEWDMNLIGTAPGANYLLCMTENPDSEYRIEEISWIAAAELADSLGYDVINTSLGYSVFMDSTMNYTYADMDGETTFISRAASMLAAKGMILANSAGNSGDDSWYYITAPADARNMLTVGAVDMADVITSFSSRGPTVDHRIKPDVVALGSGTAVQHENGLPARGGGTSFSSPVIAGCVAVLWQAYPEMTANQIIDAVIQSADRFKNPDITYGFGIPDFARAYFTINSYPNLYQNSKFDIYPNPADDWILIKLPEGMYASYQLEYFDISGRLRYTQEVWLPGGVTLPADINPGIYILRIKTDNGTYFSRLIKN